MLVLLLRKVVKVRICWQQHLSGQEFRQKTRNWITFWSSHLICTFLNCIIFSIYVHGVFVLLWTTMTKLFESFVNVCKSTDTNKQFETCFPICLICVTKFSQTCQLRKNYYKWSYPFPTEVPIYGITVYGHTISRKRTLRKGTDQGISLNGMSKARKPKCMTAQT